MAEKGLSFIDAVEIRDALYFPSHASNGIYRYDKASNKLERVAYDSCYATCEELLYRRVIHKGNLVYFLPLYSNRILVLDLYSFKKRFIDIPVSKKSSGRMIKYTNICEVKGGYLLIPFILNKGIDFFSVEKNEVIELNELNNNLKRLFGTDNDPRVKYYAAAVNQENVYIIEREQGILFRITKNDFQVEKCIDLRKKVGGIACDGDKIWIIVPAERSVCCWDYEKKTLKSYSICVDCSENDFRDKLFLFNLPSGVCITVNDDRFFLQYSKEKDAFTVPSFVKEVRELGLDFIEGGMPFLASDKKGNETWLFPKDANGVLIIDDVKKQVHLTKTNTEEFYKEREKINKEIETEFYLGHISYRNGFIREGEMLGNTGEKSSLYGFLRSIAERRE